MNKGIPNRDRLVANADATRNLDMDYNSYS